MDPQPAERMPHQGRDPLHGRPHEAALAQGSTRQSSDAQDLHITHVYIVGVEYSLVSLTHPRVTTLLLQDDRRGI